MNKYTDTSTPIQEALEQRLNSVCNILTLQLKEATCASMETVLKKIIEEEGKNNE